jgi:hypothetical protein
MFSKENKKFLFSKTCKLNAKLRAKFASVNAPLQRKLIDGRRPFSFKVACFIRKLIMFASSKAANPD